MLLVLWHLSDDALSEFGSICEKGCEVVVGVFTLAEDFRLVLRGALDAKSLSGGCFDDLFGLVL